MVTSMFKGMILFSKALFFLAFFSCVAALHAEEKLNEAYVIQKLDEFEAAYIAQDTTFFNLNLSEEATFTIHSRQMQNKHAIQYTKKELVDGELFQHPQIMDKLERKKQEIEFYNENTQALLKYKLGPKRGSDFRALKGYSVETEMLFQLKKGNPKIVSIISHINISPKLEAARDKSKPE